MINIIKMIGLTTLLLFILGCAAKLVDLSKVSYMSPELSHASLTESGIGILPTTAGEGQEGYRRPTNDAFVKSFKRIRPEILIETPQSCLDKINSNGFTKEYSDLITNYEKTSILDKQVLQKIGNAVGKRYLLYSKLIQFHETSRIAPKSLTSGVTNVYSKNVEVFVQVWDTQRGDIVWEGIGKNKVNQDELTDRQTYDVYTFDTMIVAACESIIKGIP